MNYITHIFRIAVGSLFIISGLVKLNDPRGFGIKLKEYFEVFGTEFMIPFSDAMSISICVLEVILGIFLLLGIARRTVVWLLLLLIVAFTFLTFYSAYYNKVTDCGCFGDAIKLTPWESFTKDIVLLVMILWLFFRQMDIKPLLKSLKINAAISLASILGATFFGLYAYFYLPFVDFLPYKIGNNIAEQMQIPANAPKDVYKTTLIYQKNGAKQSFSEENYPWEDSTWTWVETRNELVSKGYKPPIHDFDIKDLEGNAYTEDILNTDYIVLITTSNVAHANTNAFAGINTLADWAQTSQPNVKFAALSGSVVGETTPFFAAQKAKYPLYLCDGTALKTMVRSNPGIILLKKGTVVKKWSAMNVPTSAEVAALLSK